MTSIIAGAWTKPSGVYHGSLYPSDASGWNIGQAVVCGGNVAGTQLYANYCSASTQVFTEPFTMGSWHNANIWIPHAGRDAVGFQLRNEAGDVSPRYLDYYQCMWQGLSDEVKAWQDGTESDAYSAWMLSPSNLRPPVGNATLHMNITMVNGGGETGVYQVGTTDQLTQRAIGAGSRICLTPSSAAATFTDSVTVGPLTNFGDANFNIGNTAEIGRLFEITWPVPDPYWKTFSLVMIKQLSGPATKYMTVWMTADAEYMEYRLLLAYPSKSWGK